MAYNADTMSFELPETDTVYVSGLPPNITERDIEEYFGSIGVIKIDKKTRGKKIWLYRDKATGGLKGDGTVSYDDPFSAASAVQWFHDKEWKGHTLSVTLAERKGAAGYGGGGGRGGGGYGGGGGGGYGDRGGGGYGDRGGGGGPFGDNYNSAAPPREYGGGGGGGGGGPPAGDWNCSSCGNMNFARRTNCNRCQAPKPADGGGGGGGGGYGGAPAGGGGGGLVTPPGGKPGDWACPQCGNHNFAWRDNCQKCQMSKAAAAGGGGAGAGGPPGGGYGAEAGGYEAAGGGYGGGGGGGYGAAGGSDRAGPGSDRGPPGGKPKVVAAPQGPPGMFKPGDWACASCGNTNWERRNTCNLCGASKPGSVDTRREGQGGGFKELDEAELEESRRRRQQYKQGAGDDDEYDEWGRPKRNKSMSEEDKRAREQAALARLYGGSSLAPSEMERSGDVRQQQPQQADRGEPDYGRGAGGSRGGRDRERSPVGDRRGGGGGGGYGDRGGGYGDRGGRDSGRDRGGDRGGSGRDYDRGRDRGGDRDRGRGDRGRY